MNTNWSIFTFINNTHLTDLSFVSCKTHLNLRAFVQCTSWFDNEIVQVLWYQQCYQWNWVWCGLGWRGRRSRRRRGADWQRVWDRQQSWRQRVAELSQAFKQTVLFGATPVLFRTKKSDKVNDQHCLSFVYSFTGIYLHTHFSLLGKYGEVVFFCTKILGYKMHPEFWADFDRTSPFSRKKWCAL